MTNKTNAMAEAAMKKKGIPCRVGTLASVARPLFNSEEKRVLGRTLNALAVDMESAAVARVAAEHGRAFFALRAISDTVDENLPSEVSDFLDETGEVRSGKVLKFAFHGPKNVRELWKLKRHSDQAALALQGAWKAVLPAFLETARAMPGPTDCP